MLVEVHSTAVNKYSRLHPARCLLLSVESLQLWPTHLCFPSGAEFAERTL